MTWVAVAAYADEELYDDTGFGTVETAADDGELYQEAGDTRAYGEPENQVVCARALYDYQAGQFVVLPSCLLPSFLPVYSICSLVS